MRAILKTFWIAPNGWALGDGKPDVSEIEIGEGPHNPGDTWDGPDGCVMRVVGRRNGVVQLEVRRVHQMMEAKAS